MKITGPDQSSKTAATKKTGKAKSSAAADASFFEGMVSGADETHDAAHVLGANTIARVDLLLAAQSAEDPMEKAANQRMRRRADKILRELDKIRLGMLTGNLSVGNMIDIADVVASHREKIADPLLAGILDEVDLRAQIEIAKMRMALDAAADARAQAT